MQLTHYTDYSLRVLIYLSLKDDKQPATIANIAEHFNIPRNHLVKVVHKLGLLNYVHTSRGKNGGIRLGMAADQIRIGDVVREMESTLNIINCDAPSPCPLTPDCKLKSILFLATDAFMGVLNQYTISDLQSSPEKLKELLHISSM